VYTLVDMTEGWNPVRQMPLTRTMRIKILSKL